MNHPLPDPEITARATIRAAVTDLTEVAGQLPVLADRTEHLARILDRLSDEVAEAAAMLRGKPAAPDERVAQAREFLGIISEFKVASRPHSVLMREDAELRRMLGQIIDVIDGKPVAR